MKIPASLPRFERPALFVDSGEYEADFYLAHQGILEKKLAIKVPPRTEAKEKQGFVGKKSGMSSLSSVSHRGAYIEDLKKKFQKKVHSAIHNFIAQHQLDEIYLFSPRYVAGRIIAGLDGTEKKKVRMKFFTERTKQDPLEMVRIFWRELESAIRMAKPLEETEEKILQRPRVRHSPKK